MVFPVYNESIVDSTNPEQLNTPHGANVRARILSPTFLTVYNTASSGNSSVYKTPVLSPLQESILVPEDDENICLNELDALHSS